MNPRNQFVTLFRAQNQSESIWDPAETPHSVQSSYMAEVGTMNPTCDRPVGQFVLLGCPSCEKGQRRLCPFSRLAQPVSGDNGPFLRYPGRSNGPYCLNFSPILRTVPESIEVPSLFSRISPKSEIAHAHRRAPAPSVGAPWRRPPRAAGLPTTTPKTPRAHSGR
eukprot:COSAG02_NODE_3248_length_7097_cov_2.679194_9_plen_165_part_00